MLTSPALSQIMLVRIRRGKKFKFIIPIAFAPFEDILEVLEDWIWLIKGLFPSWKKIENFSFKKNAIEACSLDAVYKHVEEGFYTFRKYRGIHMVEIDAKDLYLSVELL